MGKRVMKMGWLITLILYFWFVGFPVFEAQAHRSGCHAHHSCPSDTGSYICGDWGKCAYCPDNDYCRGGEPIAKNQTREKSSNQKSEESVKSVPKGFSNNKNFKNRIKETSNPQDKQNQ